MTSRWDLRLKSALLRLKTYTTDTNAFLETTDLTELQLQTRLRTLTSFVKRVEEIQKRLDTEPITEDGQTEGPTTEDDFINTMMDCEEVLAQLTVRLDISQTNKSQATVPDTSTVQPIPTIQHQYVQLPKLVLPTFQGDMLRWQEFWDSFESAIHSHPTLSNVDKFNYLIAQLKGDAKRCIAGLPITDLNYDIAITLLKDRFAKKQVIVNSHYCALRDMPPIKSSDTVTLRRGFDNIEKHMRCLQALGEDVTSNYFVSQIFSKLPYEIVLKVEEMNISGELDVKTLCKFVNNLISIREKAEQLTTSTPSTSSYSNSFVTVPNPQADTKRLTTTHSLVGNDKLNCIFCEGTHWNDQCTKYQSAEARKKAIQGRCYVCLSKGHTVKFCKSHKRCVYCKQQNNHNRSLCTKQFPTDQISRNTIKVDTRSTNHAKALPASNFNPSKGPINTEESALISMSESVILQTATITLRNADTKQETRCGVLFDSGSQRSYVSKGLASKLSLNSKYCQSLSLFTFGNRESKTVETQVTDVRLLLNDDTCMDIIVNIVPHITGKVVSSTNINLNTIASSYPKLKLADGQFTSQNIDLLIGNDYYFDIIQGQKIEISPGLFLVNSKFGWIVTGRHNDNNDHFPLMYESSFLTLVKPNNLFPRSPQTLKPDINICEGDDIKNLWQLETIGIKDDPHVKDDDIALIKFNETVKFENGRYSVSWPWKDYPPNLPTNYNLSLGRLKSLTDRLSDKHNLLCEYDSVIQTQLKDGIIERVSFSDRNDGVLHYIPHHPIITESKTSTKLRIVYDASAKTRKGNNSLNDCLYRGPVILENLCSLLLRFRMNAIGIIADIEKAFLQINLQTPDRDVTRFLWLKDPLSAPTKDNIEEYRFCRVPFGIISSPFLLSATVFHHLSNCELDNLNERLKSSFYVDNVVTGCDTDQEATTLFTTASSLFSDINMNLRCWSSNSKTLMTQIPMEKTTTENPTDVNVLGLRWNTNLDNLHIKPVNNDRNKPISKRQVLSTISSVFDPLGLLSPVTLKAKIFLKQLWEDNLDWDELLDEPKCREWNIICDDIIKVTEVSIPRFAGLRADHVELHCFTDASKDVYSCAVYIKLISKETVKVTLMFCKSHLTPKSKPKITLPRLELLGVLIGTRALRFVEESLKFPVVNKILWTDSQCVLRWISTTKLLPKFVERRVMEIKTNTETQFRYVPTDENPADMATRGKTVDNLKHCNEWWSGPQWLSCSQDSWPDWSSDFNKPLTEDDMVETIEENVVTLTTKTEDVSETSPFGIDIQRFSLLSKLILTTVFCKRFISGCRRNKQPNHVIPTSEELKDARLLWIKHVQNTCFSETLSNIRDGRYDRLQNQLGLFVDMNGLIRCKGRISNADLEEYCKFPILLPKNDLFTQLLIEECHCKIFHMGVQQTLSELRKSFWIIHGRAEVNRVLRKCLKCLKYEGGPYKLPQIPSLPTERVTESIPFQFTGLDYFGPLYIKSFQDSRVEVSKVYGCIFTCLVTRAVHLEITNNLSSEEFLLSLRRFVGRRGTPKKIYLDNATQFKKASSFLNDMFVEHLDTPELLSYVSENHIEFTYIPEFAPWMGGMYERLISLIKRCLRKSIGSVTLTKSQLDTVMIEIEAVVNSRPLVYVSSSDQSLTDFIITPGHFLNFHGKNGFVNSLNECQENDMEFISKVTESDLLKMWKKGTNNLNSFWKIWKKDYLLSLRERTQHNIKQGRILSTQHPQVGDVVHVHDTLPRGTWRLGKIEVLNVSADGNVRSAKLKLGSGKYITRPINLLYPIEVSDVNSGKKKGAQNN